MATLGAAVMPNALFPQHTGIASVARRAHMMSMPEETATYAPAGGAGAEVPHTVSVRSDFTAPQMLLSQLATAHGITDPAGSAAMGCSAPPAQYIFRGHVMHAPAPVQ